MYEFAAKLTLILHFIFIIFVIFGGLLIFKLRKVIIPHILCFVWGIYIELTHSVCPLTYLENWFLKKASLENYSLGYIQNYLVPIVYPTNLTTEMQIYFALLLIAINLLIYILIIYKWKKNLNPK